MMTLSVDRLGDLPSSVATTARIFPSKRSLHFVHTKSILRHTKEVGDPQHQRPAMTSTQEDATPRNAIVSLKTRAGSRTPIDVSLFLGLVTKCFAKHLRCDRPFDRSRHERVHDAIQPAGND